VLLPFLEQDAVAQHIDFDQSYELAQPVALGGELTPLSAVRIPTYVCPSEIRDQPRFSGGKPQHYPLNYAVNAGTWLVYNPMNQGGGNGAFFPGSRLRPGDIRDGLSNTLAVAEVKAWNPYFRNAGLVNPGVPTAADICGLGGDFKEETGHTEWVDGRVHQIGFTSTFTPNAPILCSVGGETYDVDWTNMQEGKSASVVTFAAVTSRSYHPRGVQALMLDGSVHFVMSQISPGTWRAMSTRHQADIVDGLAK
jgi:hypothetical protein